MYGFCYLPTCYRRSADCLHPPQAGSGGSGALGPGEVQAALVSSEQRVRELELELSELERECALREKQEGALKETVRDLGRELERLRISGQQGAF